MAYTLPNFDYYRYHQHYGYGYGGLVPQKVVNDITTHTVQAVSGCTTSGVVNSDSVKPSKNKDLQSLIGYYYARK